MESRISLTSLFIAEHRFTNYGECQGNTNTFYADYWDFTRHMRRGKYYDTYQLTIL